MHHTRKINNIGLYPHYKHVQGAINLVIIVIKLLYYGCSFCCQGNMGGSSCEGKKDMYSIICHNMIERVQMGRESQQRIKTS